jgi:hypothetical protein
MGTRTPLKRIAELGPPSSIFFIRRSMAKHSMYGTPVIGGAKYLGTTLAFESNTYVKGRGTCRRWSLTTQAWRTIASGCNG